MTFAGGQENPQRCYPYERLLPSKSTHCSPPPSIGAALTECLRSVTVQSDDVRGVTAGRKLPSQANKQDSHLFLNDLHNV